MRDNAPGIVFAIARSAATLRLPRVWGYVLAPAICAILLWLLATTFWLGDLTLWLLTWPPISWLVGWEYTGFAHFLAVVGAWLMILALAYLSASLLAAVVILPLLLNWLAATEYGDLARMGSDNLIASTVNSLAAVVIYVALWLLTLPLWLIPGVGLVLPIVLLAALNRRTFAFDSLAAHASPIEWQELRKRHSRPLFMLGLIFALLAHVPVLGLLVPTLTALAFLHYTLNALRQLRQGAVIVGSAVVVEDEAS